MPAARFLQAALATSAFVATHLSAAAATLGWAGSGMAAHGQTERPGRHLRIGRGLVAITPASGFVGPMSALVIGLLAGVVCYFMVSKIKAIFGYDDSLDAFGVHGAGGTLGALLTGVFAVSGVNAVFKDPQGRPLPVGLIEGNGHQFFNQAAGVLIAWMIAAIGTYLILKIVDAIIGLRITADDEIMGLDLSQHGEEGYNM